MAEPFSLYPRESRDDWAKYAEQWVPAWKDEHPDITSADAMYATMRESGFYIPRSYVRDAWRQEKAADVYLPIINQLSPNEVISRDWFKETKWNYSENYAYKIQVTGVSQESGESSSRMITLLSDENLTIDEIQSYAMSMGNLYGFDVIFEDYDIEITDTLHKTGTPW